MGFGTNLLGHSPACVNEAMAEQLQLGVEVGPQSPLAGQVAELMCELTGMERTVFCNTGSEAVLAAIRVARTVTGRDTIVYFTGDYHGINDEVLMRAGGSGGAMPAAPGIPPQNPGNVLILEYGDPASLEVIRKRGRELAAVLVEPVQSRRPDFQPGEFLRELRKITQETETALIFDEVITGFRCHLGGAQTWFGVKADLAAYGKIIGGGMPIGAMCGQAKYLDALDGGQWSYGDNSFPETGMTFFAGTYVRHPLTMAAALATLKHLKKEGPALQQRLNRRTEQWAGSLNAFLQENKLPLQIRHFSSFFYVHFESDVKYGSLLYFLLREKGVHIAEGRTWFLSTAHTDQDLELTMRAFKESVLEMRQGGFLPSSSIAAPAPIPAEEKKTVPVPRMEPAVSFQPAPSNRDMQFSLYFFGNYPAAFAHDKYEVIVEAARFADQHGFTAIWIPERHFHSVGGFSPNPSVIAAALARETKNLQLRGGSVVLPLHHPIRIAEEWSVVDNLSKGRVGISIASGWHPNDFVFAPEAFQKRKEICSEGVEIIKKAWRGESVRVRGGAGNDLDVKLHPLPMQPELPLWLTCIQEESYVRAGEMGVRVLGYLMNQTAEDLARKIKAYREAFARSGHDPKNAHVTVLLHTFIGTDLDETREKARKPLCDYLRSYLDNSQKRLESEKGRVDVDPADLDYLVSKSFEDYVQGKALIGTPESCAEVVSHLSSIGVDEVGCFLDFGIDAASVMASLPQLNELKSRSQKRVQEMGDRTIPMTEAEQGLWFLVQAQPEASRTYTEWNTLELRGKLNLAAMRQALQSVVDRHEALRTTIEMNDDFQIVHPGARLEVSLVDLSQEGGKRDIRLAEHLKQCEKFTFDFRHAPVLRAEIVKLGEDRHFLLLAFHHLLGNGPSYWVFFEDLCALYDAACGGRSVLSESAPLQLSDFVRWSADQEKTAKTNESETFWLKQFDGPMPVLELPADRPRSIKGTSRGAREHLSMDQALTNALRKAGAAEKSSLFMVLFSAYRLLLHRLSGQKDLVVGVPYDAEVRTLPGGRGLFANTTHMLPLRSRVEQETTFPQLLAATKAQVLESGEHQNYFFGRIIQKRNDRNRVPLFSVTFNYESGKFQKNAAGLDIELITDKVPYRCPRDAAMFELGFNIAEKDGQLLVEVDYDADLFDSPTIRHWLSCFKWVLENIVTSPSQAIWKWPLAVRGADQRPSLDRKKDFKRGMESDTHGNRSTEHRLQAAVPGLGEHRVKRGSL